MLDFQLVQAPFRYGIDEGTDPKQVPFGTLVRAKNVCWLKSGRLQKRQGTTSLGTVTGATRLFTRGDDELCVVADNLVHSYNGSTWTEVAGQISNVGLTWSTVHDGHAGVQASDTGLTSDGKLVTAWVTGEPTHTVLINAQAGQVYYQIADQDSDTLLTPPRLADTARTSDVSLNVRVLTSGTNWVIVYTDGGTGLRAVVNGNTSVELRNDVGTSDKFDACIIGSNFVVAYHVSTGGIALYSYSIAATPVQQASGAVTGETGTSFAGISIDGSSSDLLWIAYVRLLATPGTRVATAHPTTLVQVLAPVQPAAEDPASPTVAVKRASATSAIVAFSYESDSPNEVGTRSVLVSSAGVASALRGTMGVKLLSRPFYLGSTPYLLVSTFITCPALSGGLTQAPIGGDVYLIEVGTTTLDYDMPHRYVGHLDVLIGGVWQSGGHANVAAVSATEAVAVSPFLSAPAAGPVGLRQGLRRVSLTIGASRPKDMWRSVKIGPETYLTAGILTAYDGRQPFDYGFAGPAFITPADTNATSGGELEEGDYIYVTVPEYTSNVGVLHRGPVSIPRTVTAALEDKVELYVIPVHLSQKQIGDQLDSEAIPVLLAVYRTVKDGSIPQRLTVEPRYNVLLQDPTYITSTIDDESADGDIGDGLELASRPTLYTEGGELDDFQPPALTTLCLYRERLFGIAGDGQSVWFSKNHASNPGVAPGFHPQLRIVFNDRLTGLAVLDERLFVFSETGIYYFAGDGPAPNGDGDDYGTPNKLQTDVGCTNPRGIVSTPMGVMFVAGDSTTQSSIYTLDRKLNVQWNGKRVQDLLDLFPNVTSAVLVPDKGQVRFSCLASDGLTGIVIVYDYQEDQWSHFVYGESLAITDALLFNGVYTFLTSGGVVYQESAATCLDAGAWVTAEIETAEVNSAGPLAYQAVRNFRIDGVSLTAHGLSVSCAFNGETTFQQGPTSFAEGVSGTTSPGQATANLSIGNRRKCRSIRFKIADTEPDTLGTGQGVAWSSMGIEVGVKRGLGRLAERQTG
jgi:hypothetical protein